LKYLPATPELECAHMLDIQAERGRGLNIHTAADAIEGVFEPYDDAAEPNPAPQGSEAAMPGTGSLPGGAPAGAGPTYAQVLDRMQKAKTTDVLDAEADLIRGIADKGQREELTAEYKRMRGAL
jgi:hypothetical protein